MPHAQDGSPFNTLAAAETLEARRLLSSAVRTGDVLRVYGDPGVDNVMVVGYADEHRDNIAVTINGATTLIRADDLDQCRIFGDTGNDRITIDSSIRNFNVRTSVFGSSGNDVIRCGNEADYVEGGTGSDRISLGNGRNFAFGYKGDDVIDGGAQRDFVSGGNGADVITGGGGRDQLQGDNGDDFILGGYADESLNEIESPDRNKDDDEGSNLPEPDGSDLIFGGRGNDTLMGQSAADVIFGQAGADSIVGGRGNDELFGMADGDTIDGTSGKDTIWGGDGTDVIRGGDETHNGEFDDIDKFIAELRPSIP